MTYERCCFPKGSTELGTAHIWRYCPFAKKSTTAGISAATGLSTIGVTKVFGKEAHMKYY